MPTIADFLPRHEATAWVGIFAPPGTPMDIVARLGADIRRVLEEPELRARMLALATEQDGRSPQELLAIIKAEIERCGRSVLGQPQGRMKELRRRIPARRPGGG